MSQCSARLTFRRSGSLLEVVLVLNVPPSGNPKPTNKSLDDRGTRIGKVSVEEHCVRQDYDGQVRCR
jgi:hypothetical protein